MSQKVSVIIPFLNEEENIPFLTEKLNSYFAEKKSDFDAEIIFVNDGSRDKSVELLKKQKHKNYQARIVSLSKNFGSHAALRAGILHSTGSHICFMYADLQDPLELIEKMFSKINEGNEICWATREQTNNSFAERSFSKFYSSLMQKYVSKSYPEKGFDIVMFTPKVREMLNANIEANSSVFLQILTLGFSQTSISYKKKERKKGKSKWTVSKKIKLFIDSFVAFSYAPIRFVTLVGIVLFFFGLLWAGYIVVRKLLFNDLQSGWPALMSILTIGFGITNISLGIIAEYLWRTLDNSRKRPVFIIDEIIDIEQK